MAAEKKSAGFWSRISRNVRLLGLVSLFNDIASEMLYPIIPVFLTAVLGAPVYIVGLIEGVAEAISNIIKFFAGWLSDKAQSRKKFVAAGYALSTVGKILYAVTFSWPAVLLARVTDRFGKGIRTAPRDALIADSSDKRYLGASFGFHRALDTTGAVVGPLLALLILLLFQNNYRLLFAIAIVPSVLGLLLLVPVKEIRPKKSVFSFNLGQLRMFSKELKLFLLITLVFALGNSSDAFIILKAKGIGYSLTAIVLLYTLYNVVYAVFSTPAGIIADKLGKARTIAAGFFIFAAVYLGFAVFAKPLWLLFAIYGLYIALTDGVGKAYISQLAPSQLKGTALGIYAGATGIGTLVASALAGALWTFVSPAAAFLLGTATALSAGLLMLFFLKGPSSFSS